jgi:outer membrane protein assembly factor BamB
MRITQKLAGVAVLALMAGCSTLNSLNPFASRSKGSQPAPLAELKGSMAVRTAWKLDIGKSNSYIFSPALVGTSVLVAGGEGAGRVDAASGPHAVASRRRPRCRPASAPTVTSSWSAASRAP